MEKWMSAHHPSLMVHWWPIDLSRHQVPAQPSWVFCGDFQLQFFMCFQGVFFTASINVFLFFFVLFSFLPFFFQWLLFCQTRKFLLGKTQWTLKNSTITEQTLKSCLPLLRLSSFQACVLMCPVSNKALFLQSNATIISCLKVAF